jgi:hypothetical protein
MPPNKGMKQTKPSILELRSLSPVFDGRLRMRAPDWRTTSYTRDIAQPELRYRVAKQAS